MEKFFNLLEHSETSLLIAVIALIVASVSKLLITNLNKKSKSDISVKVGKGDNEIILKDFNNDQTERIIKAIDEINKRQTVKFGSKPHI